MIIDYYPSDNDKNLVFGIVSLSLFILLHLFNPYNSPYFYIYVIPWLLFGYLSYCFIHKYYYNNYLEKNKNKLKAKLEFESKTFIFCSIFLIGLSIYPGINNMLGDILSVPYFVLLSQMIILPFVIIKAYHDLSEEEKLKNFEKTKQKIFD